LNLTSSIFIYYREVTWRGVLIADLGRVRHGSCTSSLTFRAIVKAAAPKLWKKLPRDFEKRGSQWRGVMSSGDGLISDADFLCNLFVARNSGTEVLPMGDRHDKTVWPGFTQKEHRVLLISSAY
jgi:hypothetical protein